MNILDIEQFMSLEDRKEQVSQYLGSQVTIEIDRPIGTPHPKDNEILYPINYGYIPGVLGGDHEELDVYLLGVDKIVENYEVEIIAIVHRYNDAEDKLVGSPTGMIFDKKEIESLINFQEQFYHTHLEVIGEYELLNLNGLKSDDSGQGFNAENKYGDKFYVVESLHKPKEHFRALEKMYLESDASISNDFPLRHGIYKKDSITCVHDRENHI